MTLRELIKFLETSLDKGYRLLKPGITHPHSYRGYYDELAFEPTEQEWIEDVLSMARACVGVTFTGWKGGEFTMHEYTPVWLSNIGESSQESLGPTLLGLMIH